MALGNWFPRDRTILFAFVLPGIALLGLAVAVAIEKLREPSGPIIDHGLVDYRGITETPFLTSTVVLDGIELRVATDARVYSPIADVNIVILAARTRDFDCLRAVTASCPTLGRPASIVPFTEARHAMRPSDGSCVLTLPCVFSPADDHSELLKLGTHPFTVTLESTAGTVVRVGLPEITVSSPNRRHR